jgi:hypothetical protein
MSIKSTAGLALAPPLGVADGFAGAGEGWAWRGVGVDCLGVSAVAPRGAPSSCAHEQQQGGGGYGDELGGVPLLFHVLLALVLGADEVLDDAAPLSKEGGGGYCWGVDSSGRRKLLGT